MRTLLASTIVLALAAFVPVNAAGWSQMQAKNWSDAQPWLVGSNYLPANSINELEMWQKETFDPTRIDIELGWAEAMGMNTMRVFLHDKLWDQNPKGFAKRIDAFLAIAQRHHIRPLFVLFDSCWDPNPKLGPQHPPIPGVHNSGWVQAPGVAALNDPKEYPRLEAYVKGVVGRFANDERILGWDVWNEPDNPGGGNYGGDAEKKVERVAFLLPQVFSWARGANPSQPLTSGLWQGGPWNKSDALNAVQKIQIAESDIISFHNYGWPEDFAKRVQELSGYGRPLLCTEYMARGAGSTFDGVLPLAKRANIGMINWGFVVGRSQTNLPWDSWQKPYTAQAPTVWFHDILYADGNAYRPSEVELIRTLSKAPKNVVPASAYPTLP